MEPEEVRHGHVTAYVIVKLCGFSMELLVQKECGPVLAKFCYQYTRNAYYWNPLVMHFQKCESTSFNPSVVAMLWSFKYLAIGKTKLHTGLYLLMETAAFLGLFQPPCSNLQATAAL